MNRSQRTIQAQVKGMEKLTGNTMGMIISDVISQRNRESRVDSHCWRLSASSIDRFLEKGRKIEKKFFITFKFSRRHNCK